MRWVVNASSADCTVSLGSNKPSPVTSTTCSATRPSVTCGLVVTLPKLPCSLIVPSSGLVWTPVTKPRNGEIASWMLCLMPSADQVITASRAPTAPMPSASPSSQTSSIRTSAFMPRALPIRLPAVWIEMFL